MNQVWKDGQDFKKSEEEMTFQGKKKRKKTLQRIEMVKSTCTINEAMSEGETL